MGSILCSWNQLASGSAAVTPVYLRPSGIVASFAALSISSLHCRQPDTVHDTSEPRTLLEHVLALASADI